MDPSRWRQVKAVLDEALSLDPNERAAYLETTCAGDPSLRSEVDSLLSHADDESLVARPAPEDDLDELEDDGLDLEGQRLGSYRVEKLIARGGMGVVYLAVRDDGVFHKRVAIKVVRPGMATRDMLRRFRNERRILAEVEHPNIAEIIDGGSTVEGRPYLVMEYVDGTPIDEHCDQKQLTIRERLELLRTVCAAVQSAHVHHVVHRDLKPSNVLVKADGTPKLLDFGIARMLTPDLSDATFEPTLFNSRAMTPGFASPEQVSGKEVTPASDVYSLGVLLYLVLSGRPPYELKNSSAVEIERIVCDTQPPSLGAATATTEQAAVARRSTPARLREHLGGDLEKIVATAMRKQAHERYSSAKELVDDIDRVLDGRPVQARGDTLRYRLVRAARSRQWRQREALAAAVVLAAAAASALWWAATRPAEGNPATNPFELGPETLITYQPGLELYPALSPDGEFLAYSAGSDNEMDIYVRHMGDGTTENLTPDLIGHHMAPQWSPDGTRILFQSETLSEARASVIDVASPFSGAAGSEPTVLLTQAGGREPLSPTWSPAADRIAYAADDEADEDIYADAIMVMSLEDGARRKITDAVRPHSLAWSPDGTRIAYVEGNPPFAFGGQAVANVAASAIRIVPLDTQVPVQITDADHVNVSPIWTVDGRNLLYLSNREGHRDIYSQAVDDAGNPLGNASRLSTGLDAHGISLASDGTRLVYSSLEHDSNVWSIPIPRDGPVSFAGAVQVTSGLQNIEGLDVSADGKWLVYDSDRGGNSDLYRLNLENRQVAQIEQLTDHAANDLIPDFSPDGSEVVFYSLRDGNREIYVLSIADRAVTRVTDSPGMDLFPSWSPDGNQIAFDSTRTGVRTIWLATRNGRDSPWQPPRQFTFDNSTSARWSPDGGETLYTSSGVGTMRVPAAGGAPRPLDFDGDHPEGFGGLMWSPDGETLYGLSSKDGNSSFWALSLESRTSELLIQSEEPRYLREFFATDARQFFFTMHRRESDILMFDLEWVR